MEKSQSTAKKKALKSLAKAAGVKSVFTIGDSLLMTGFGQGSNAVIEKKVDAARVITPLVDEESFSAKYHPKAFDVEGKIKIAKNEGGEKEPIHTILADDYDSEHTDLLGMKDILEEKYFGKTFDDNIHVQIAYNIMDIEKIMTPYINNIVYTLNELMRNNAEEDFLGFKSHFSTRNTFVEVKSGTSTRGNKPAILKLVRESFLGYMNSDNYGTTDRLAYFGELFYQEVPNKERKDTHWELKPDETIYNILAMLADLRHYCTDGSLKGIDNFPYRLDALLQPEAKKVLDKLFYDKARSLGEKEFGDSAGKSDITILLRIFDKENGPIEEKKQLVKRFYDFKVSKTYKNLGFSIKKLREVILTLPEAQIYASDKYASVRHKLYSHFDFILSEHFVSMLNAKNIQDNEIFLSLRACRSEEENMAVYQNEAAKAWRSVGSKMKKAFKEVTDIRNLDKDAKAALICRDKQLLSEIEAIPTKVSYFSELIYLMTCLLDGKEINTLCTSLIKKFSNIAALNDVLRHEKVGLGLSYLTTFTFFEASEKIVEELRQVNNMARMSKPLGDVKTKSVMYNEAAQILGASVEDRNNLKYLLNLDNHDCTVNKKGEKIPNKNFRNFIINNVICSRRFLYLVRYMSPAKVRKVATNPAVIRFVLKEIPDAQIERYYQSATGRSCKDLNLMRFELAERLAKVNFRYFEKVNNEENVEQNKNGTKARLQAIVRLYLTVPYLFVKNMININARYVMACHCLERDYFLRVGGNGKDIKRTWLAEQYLQKMKDEHAALRKDFEEKRASGVEVHSPKRMGKLYHQIQCLEKDMKNGTDDAYTKYRNAIAHLNVISNLNRYVTAYPSDYRIPSYFAAYHYATQLYIKKVISFDPNNLPSDSGSQAMMHYYKMLDQNHSYQKDFVKALNFPFSYCYPRYKNLSIEPLFDKNIEYDKNALSDREKKK